jgi:hypothetical protein
MTNLNKLYIIEIGGELSNVEYRLTKPENAEYHQNTETCTSHLFCPFILQNKEFKQAQEQRNGGELSNVEYLPTKPENAKYPWNVGTRTSHLFYPFKIHNNKLKQLLDHNKWWRIDLTRLPAAFLCSLSLAPCTRLTSGLRSSSQKRLWA